MNDQYQQLLSLKEKPYTEKKQYNTDFMSPKHRLQDHDINPCLMLCEGSSADAFALVLQRSTTRFIFSSPNSFLRIDKKAMLLESVWKRINPIRICVQSIF
ncbi:coiled-coil-helix-coiled-coil-helix domain-containing protein 7 isoform X2 [Protobothrops mucrosquamatus]|uniref:coiled-coil-helix-coiled-coil-helix domain-containing protein 7 isoform X2 n=1 Tax=Protobothrops mucrosquamatus TaxID=103944 RepID=UPI000775972B|nr:coiled-coil-helix-coiled-coil-helix domain-containing protein 7 isoform X2 [Protobothrops mucrosquamatus]